MALRCILLGCALAAVVAGCDDQDPAPAPPPGTATDGGGIGRFPGGRVPDHVDDEPEDGEDPVVDAPQDRRELLPEECFDVEPSTTVNAVRTPADFDVTRTFATWEGSCPDPVLVIGLSEGACPDGGGQELRMEIDPLDIREGVIRPNTPLLLRPEPAELTPRVRFRRPPSFASSGLWGTCAGVGGDITFSSLGTQAGTPLRADGIIGASFAYELTECPTPEAGQNVAVVNGVFEVELARGLEDVCPP